jgi:predicted alpha/beta superfamily hydrolase
MRASSQALLTALFLGVGALTTAAAQEPGNEVVSGRYETVFSSVLGEDRVIKIRLPEDYENSGNVYPVLYVLDAEWAPQYDLAVGTVGFAAEAEIIPEMIVVGISNTNRDRDMIPTVIADRPGSGGSSEFLQFIAEELVPHIAREYRTDGRNVLYGGSNAGLFTVFAILQRPDIFTAGIAASPMIGHSSEFMFQLANELRSGNRFSGRVLYMVYGENDYPKCTEHVHGFSEHMNALRPSTFRSELVRVSNEGHVPYVSLYNGLRYVFAGGR